MGRIRLLPAEVAEQIAAGEVVERPASVVKELCENALDAGARRVDVELVDGGQTLVAVSDDGEGMAPEDARIAFQRHATSKIRSLDDLSRLRTLGFRGEALPSLAAVAHVELVTRRGDQEAATRLEPGGPGQAAAAAPGTRVAVRDLFYNVPARRKALQSAAAELAACVEVIVALALCRPGVAFSLRHGERELLRTHGSGALEDAVLALWGHDAARALLPVRAVDAGVAVTGVVGGPLAARANRGRQVFAVNGRPVRSDALRGALEAAFHGLLMVHRHPCAVLAIECDPAGVDVNVHPRKLEVRFAEEEPVRRLVFQGVRAALQRSQLIPDLPLPSAATSPANARAAAAEPPWTTGAARAPALQLELREDPAAYEPRHLPELRPIGQLAATYILAEGADGLYVLDQHAAHERVFFEAFERSAGPAQPLAAPETLHLDPHEAVAFRRWQAAVAELGFEIDPLDGGALLVRVVPAGLTARSLVDVLARLEGDPSGEPEVAVQRARRALAACKAAIKANQRLSPLEIERLLADLAACAEPFHCPHGRPTVLHLGIRELEHHFRRI